MTVSRPLPGIRFEPQARPIRDVLPRMDIPVFVGFAASGPLHVPVAIEDVGQLAMIFGGDVELPRPDNAREPRYAYLVSSVRAFFRNGGRRCWVIRVARSTAIANRFVVPGLEKVLADGTLAPALVYARSEGSWSDAVRIKTNLVPVPLNRKSFDLTTRTLTIDVSSAREVEAGDLVRVSWQGSDIALYLFVTSVVAVTPPTMRVSGKDLWLDERAGTTVPALLSVPGGTEAFERLEFDLTAQCETDAPLRMSGLGFTPAHARYVGALPTDAQLFEDISQFVDGATPQFRPRKRVEFAPNFTNAEEAPLTGWPELWRASASPRFTLSILGASEPFDGAVYVPLGMTALFSKPAKPELLPGSELERDGLDAFDASLFLDEHLDDARARDVLDHADALRYQANIPLTGIHAALAIEEATMLAVPDAVHRGWHRENASPLASPPASSPLAHPELWRWIDCRQSPPSTAPNVIAGFVDCTSLEPVTAPVLSATDPDGGTYDLTWTTEAGALEELQEATQPDFSDAATVSIGSTGSITFRSRAAGDYFYRVRRLRGGRTSEWSNGVSVRVISATGFVTPDDEDESESLELMTIHKAMVRMCAARADLVAILSLPRHYSERLAITHATSLTAQLESNVASYGALWHPWLIAREDDAGPLRVIPPDGATAGVMATRAVTRGAWVAPANEPLRGVLALTPAIPEEARQALQDAAVNLIRREPSGFLCLDSDTLSTDNDVRPLNVRRLLILVRRAALRTGYVYTFEPHSFTLRNTIRRGFESMLSSMFLRGAFAGNTAKSSFQVITDETVNTSQTMDQGRFIAELRVAPSRPLSFLTIRLLQRGETSTAVEVR